MRHGGHLLLAALDRWERLAIVMAEVRAQESPRIAEVNGAFCRVTGLEREAVEGAALESLACPQTNPETLNRLLAAIRQGEPMEGELQLAGGKGQFWFGFRMTQLRDPLSGRLHAVLLGQDITASRRRAQEQAATQALFAAMFLKVDVAVALVGADGRVFMANPAMQALFGYTTETLTGMHVRDLVDPAEAAAAQRNHERQIAGEPTYRRSLRALLADGQLLPVRITSALIQRPDLERFRVITILPEGGPPAEAESAKEVQAAAIPALPSTATVEMGEVRMLSLDALKEAAGKEWEATAGKLMLAAEAVIKRRLRPADVFSRAAETSFLIWFADRNEEANAARLTAMAREIRIRLLGLFGESPLAQVRTMAVRVTMEGEQAPSPERLSQMAEKVEAKREDSRAEARALLERVLGNPPAELLRVTDRDFRPTGYAWLDLPRALRGRLNAAEAMLAEEDHPPGLDRLLLQLALQGIQKDRELGQAHLFLLPIAYDHLLSRRQREALLDRLRLLEGPARQRLLCLISDIPADTAPERVREAMQLLAPLVQGVGLLTTSPELPAETFLACRPALVAVEAEVGEVPPEEKSFNLIGKARAASIPVLVRVAQPVQMKNWRELGATLFAIAARALPGR